MEVKTIDVSNMIWILTSEDDKTHIPFQGSEQECLDMWDILAEQGHRIKTMEHVCIWDKDHHPFASYSPL